MKPETRIFNVVGANANTGADVTLTVKATDSADAAAKANEWGIFVSDVQPITHLESAPAAAGAETAYPWRWRVSLLSPRQRRRTLFAGAATVIAVTALMCWWVGVNDRRLERPPGGTSAGGMPNTPEEGTLPHMSASTDYSAPDIRTIFSGTFSTPGNDLSITFNYPLYSLNPSPKYVWANGTTGTWEIYAQHQLLTPSERSDGWYILTMTPPGDPTTTIPAHVKFEVGSDGRITSVRFGTFLGLPVPSGALVMYHND